MANATKNFSKEELILLLEKGTAQGGAIKRFITSFKIVSELISFLQMSKILRKIVLGELYLAWMIILC